VVLLFDARAQFVAAHARHDDVRQYQVGHCNFHVLERFLPAARREHLVAGLGEKRAQRLQLRGAVIHDLDAVTAHWLTPARASRQGAMPSRGRMASARPRAIVSRAMPNTMDDSSSCAITKVPRAWAISRPSAPSVPMPVMMTAVARSP